MGEAANKCWSAAIMLLRGMHDVPSLGSSHTLTLMITRTSSFNRLSHALLVSFNYLLSYHNLISHAINTLSFLLTRHLEYVPLSPLHSGVDRSIAQAAQVFFSRWQVPQPISAPSRGPRNHALAGRATSPPWRMPWRGRTTCGVVPCSSTAR